MAAEAANQAGARVILCDENPRLGGALLSERIEVHGRPGHEWALDAPSGHVALCATADGLPVYWTASNPKAPYITYNFTNVKVGAVPADTFALPAECSGPLTRCPGGKVETFEIYQAHPEGKFGLNNRNVADLLGDTMFLCFSSSAKKNSSSSNDDENEYVTIAGDVNNNNNHRPRLGVDGHGLVGKKPHGVAGDRLPFPGWIALPHPAPGGRKEPLLARKPRSPRRRTAGTVGVATGQDREGVKDLAVDIEVD